jgi:hypothetical protein
MGQQQRELVQVAGGATPVRNLRVCVCVRARLQRAQIECAGFNLCLDWLQDRKQGSVFRRGFDGNKAFFCFTEAAQVEPTSETKLVTFMI